MTTFVVGLREDEIIAPLVLDGSMTGEVFRGFVAQMLASSMHRGCRRDGQTRRSRRGWRPSCHPSCRSEPPLIATFSPDLNFISLPIWAVGLSGAFTMLEIRNVVCSYGKIAAIKGVSLTEAKARAASLAAELARVRVVSAEADAASQAATRRALQADRDALVEALSEEAQARARPIGSDIIPEFARGI